MFLFRTSGPSEAAPTNPVLQGIRQGADRTGTSFDYLVKTAQRESALDPEAKAGTSSATGLFQFIEQTWLGMVRSEGPRHGLEDAAKAITQTADGRLSVADPQTREKIMALRRDPQVAATMAGAFTQRNREQLSSALGREPTGGELYIAHVLGARGAQDLIATVQNTPQRAAARDFPDAAAANRNIFFEKSGKARSAADVYSLLASQHANIATAAGEPYAASSAERSGLMGLFSTGGSRKPVSDAVARLWTGQRGQGLQLASLEPAQRFFPNSAGTTQAPEADVPASPGRSVTAPLPPQRPEGLTPAQPSVRSHRPLNLNAFLRQGLTP
jgi:hypothetical protein